MDNLQNLQPFLRTIEMGSFSAVGRDQGISQSAVSKQIAALEATLGIQLFRRTTRKLSPTGEALQLYRKRHLKAVSTSTLRVSKVMSITSSSGEHFDDRDWQCWKPQGAAELRA